MCFNKTYVAAVGSISLRRIPHGTPPQGVPSRGAAEFEEISRAAKTHLLFMVRLQRRSMIKYMVQRWGADW